MKHILIVDDDPVSVLILKKNLELIHVKEEIMSFSNGKEASLYLKNQYSEEEKYFIFLDINMPQMNGWEFLNEIDPFAKKTNTYIFMLTSSVNKIDMDKAAQYLLIEKYLTKPISKDTLKEIIDKNDL